MPSAQEDSYSGAYSLEIYGEPARKKRKKKRKRRKRPVHGCPVARASGGTARAASTCHWVVNFRVSQKGLPAKSFPSDRVFPQSIFTPGFVESETQAIGKIFFSAEPSAGRTTVGRVVAILIHTDTYSLPIPFAFTDGEVKVEAITGTYLRRTGEARIMLKAFVTQVTGPPFSVSLNGKSIEAGDKTGVLLVAEPPREDRLVIVMTCAACGAARGYSDGSHGHHFIEEREDQLSVKIGLPQPL